MSNITATRRDLVEKFNHSESFEKTEKAVVFFCKVINKCRSNEKRLFEVNKFSLFTKCRSRIKQYLKEMTKLVSNLFKGYPHNY